MIAVDRYFFYKDKVIEEKEIDDKGNVIIKEIIREKNIPCLDITDKEFLDMDKEAENAKD